MTGERNNLNSNDILNKIRCKYIIIQIFNNLRQTKLLDIINYNKQYQKLMKKKLKDYQNEYFKIEMEIIPKKNSSGKFINTMKNIHIYFNDNKKIIKKKVFLKKII